MKLDTYCLSETRNACSFAAPELEHRLREHQDGVIVNPQGFEGCHLTTTQAHMLRCFVSPMMKWWRVEPGSIDELPPARGRKINWPNAGIETESKAHLQ